MDPVSQLCSAAWNVVPFEGVSWRLIKLTPALAAQAGILWNMVGTLVGKSDLDEAIEASVKRAQEAKDRDDLVQAMEAYASARRLREADRAKLGDSEVDRVELAILSHCVHSVRVGEGRWVEARVVPRADLQDEKKGRVWVESLPTALRGMLIAAALVHYREAQDVLRPFRGDVHAPGPGPGGAEVRADAP